MNFCASLTTKFCKCPQRNAHPFVLLCQATAQEHHVPPVSPAGVSPIACLGALLLCVPKMHMPLRDSYTQLNHPFLSQMHV